MAVTAGQNIARADSYGDTSQVLFATKLKNFPDAADR